MLELDKHLVLDDKAIASPNLCDRFSAEDLDRIGSCVAEGYRRDRLSRFKWERRTQAALDLAMQVQKDKAFPWPGCANIAFPLVSVAALQFHSRAYPAIISGTDVAKCRVIGADPSGSKTARAERISMHMSWQVLEEQKEWEEQKDRLLINLPIVGTCFVKSYWDGEKGRKVDETVLAQDLVVDYWSKSIECAPRKTHCIPFSRNQIYSGIERGIYRDVREEAWYMQPPAPRGDQSAASAARNNRIGQEPQDSDETTPFQMLEQHVDLDLDRDGYAEPYIITVEENSEKVIRIVCGFDRPEDVQRNRAGEIISIRRMEYFTKYEFIPSPDGGIYGVGFGVLLGPLNESVNSLINQMLDAGTMQTTRGGFLGRGAKMRSGNYTFAPFQWQRVDSSGDDLRKSIVPLDVGEPSAVLFQLLGLVINYVERLSGTTDPMVGENPGQNTPAENLRTMVQEGQRVYSAVFKRVWRSLKEEFKKDYILNGLYMPLRKNFGEGLYVLREDYLGNPDEISPAADPNVTSDAMAMQQALMLKQFAASTPGYDVDAVERYVLSKMKVPGIDRLYPGVQKTGAPKDAKVQIQEMKNQVDMAWLELERTKTIGTMLEEKRMNDAYILEIQASIMQTQDELEGDKADRQVAILNAQLGMLKQRNETVSKQLDLVLKQMDVSIKELELRRAKTESVGGSDGGNVRRLGSASSNGGAAETRAA